jgi:hypothetical protein
MGLYTAPLVEHAMPQKNVDGLGETPAVDIDELELQASAVCHVPAPFATNPAINPGPAVDIEPRRQNMLNAARGRARLRFRSDRSVPATTRAIADHTRPARLT